MKSFMPTIRSHQNYKILVDWITTNEICKQQGADKTIKKVIDSDFFSSSNNKYLLDMKRQDRAENMIAAIASNLLHRKCDSLVLPLRGILDKNFRL